MENKEDKLRALIRGAVEQYCADEEAYSDDTLLMINISDMEVRLADADCPDADAPGTDSYQVLDFVCPDPDAPGSWMPDDEAIAEAAADCC